MAELKRSATFSHTPMAFLLLNRKGGGYPLVLNLDRVANWWSPVELHKDPPVNLIKASGLKGLVSRDLFPIFDRTSYATRLRAGHPN